MDNHGTSRSGWIVPIREPQQAAPDGFTEVVAGKPTLVGFTAVCPPNAKAVKGLRRQVRVIDRTSGLGDAMARTQRVPVRPWIELFETHPAT
jgi:hypothetical protein